MAAVELPLDIADIAIKTNDIRTKRHIIKVESTVTGAICHKCGRHIIKRFNKEKEVELRHTSVFGKPVLLRIALTRCQ